MGQVQEQRYVCKICSKSCVSGKSLGGHMRVHSALITASKRLAKEKSGSEIQIEEGNHDQENCKLLSNSAFPDEEEIEIGDGDQGSNYELRENPKKSWRLSDPKNGGASKIKASCKECNKEFPSLRALSGHMRSHSIKNKKVHKCKTCGKGFDSVRAMYGHMKSHSTRSKGRDDDKEESLSSDLDDLCPVRRKRSRIGYKNVPSSSSGLAFEDVEKVAKCLMMLSRGEFTESSDDDDSVYYGANSSWKAKDSGGDDGDKDKVKSSLLPDHCVSDSTNAFAEKNVSESDHLGSMFAAAEDDHEMEFDFGKSYLETEADDHEILKDFVKKRGRNCDKVFDSCHDSGRKSFSKDTRTALLYVTSSDSKLDCSDNPLEQERAAGTANVTVCLSKNKEHECPICFKVFTSGQALGGHKRAHYNGPNESKSSNELMAANQEVASDVRDLLDLNYPMINVEEGAKSDVGIDLWWADRSCEHESLVLTN